jgi:hypothetical protein
MAPLGLLGSCLSFPTQELYDVHLLRVLVYLARTRSLGITYSKHADNAAKLRAFADSNWAVARSTTGYTIILAGAGIESVSRRQHCISMSPCEAELNALAECAIELLHVSATLAFIGHEQDHRHRGVHRQQGRVRPMSPLHLRPELPSHRQEDVQHVLCYKLHATRYMLHDKETALRHSCWSPALDMHAL